MTIIELCKKAYEMAVAKGWYEIPRSSLEFHALIHSEVSEATEEARKGSPPVYLVNGKPEGELIELADVIIRIADYCGSREWDLNGAIREKLAYNSTRPFRHGNKLY